MMPPYCRRCGHCCGSTRSVTHEILAIFKTAGAALSILPKPVDRSHRRFITSKTVTLGLR
jgi:hypothetical protein